MSLSSFIWSVADLLRGDYKQSEYGKVILPFTVLRRMDCVLEKTKDAVLAENAARKKTGINPDPFFLRKAEQSFYNTLPMDMKTVMDDQRHIRNLGNWVRFLDWLRPCPTNLLSQSKANDRRMHCAVGNK
jgi:type I restriction enzyme M protein